jgi:hypothetical protein
VNPPRQIQKHGRSRWMIDLRTLGSGREFLKTDGLKGDSDFDLSFVVHDA